MGKDRILTKCLLLKQTYIQNKLRQVKTKISENEGKTKVYIMPTHRTLICTPRFTHSEEDSLLHRWPRRERWLGSTGEILMHGHLYRERVYVKVCGSPLGFGL